jgi:hypothetical protein
MFDLFGVEFASFAEGDKIICIHEFETEVLLGLDGDIKSVKLGVGTSATVHSISRDFVNMELDDGSLFNMFIGDASYYWKIDKPTSIVASPHHKNMIVKENGNLIIGYWASHQDSNRDRYNGKYPWPEDFVDPNWCGPEKDLVVAYLNRGKTVNYYKGYSCCRICGKTKNGSFERTDDKYTWPEGFVHYVSEHNVKPAQEFIDHVLNSSPEIKDCSSCLYADKPKNFDRCQKCLSDTARFKGFTQYIYNRKTAD